jgi:prolipoprotein diacylglyceryltransferase
MKYTLEFVLYGLILVTAFIFGMIVSTSRIQNNCDKLSSFYVDSKVYECKLK